MTRTGTDNSQTDKAVYFVVSTSKDGRVSTTLERKIPIVTIRAISLTNLQDDFVVCLALIPSHGKDQLLKCVGTQCEPM